MKNSADVGGCYPPQPSATVDNTFLHLQNSSYPTQVHSIIAKYNGCLRFGRSLPKYSHWDYVTCRDFGVRFFSEILFILSIFLNIEMRL